MLDYQNKYYCQKSSVSLFIPEQNLIYLNVQAKFYKVFLNSRGTIVLSM